jgi:hypothetical protein
VALEGESEVAVGIGPLMVKVRAFDVPPPGEGFTTVTEAVPAVAVSLVEIAAVNCALLTKVVVRALPFHCTVEPDRKLVPVIERVNAAPPAVALEGESDVALGAGLLMVKVRAFDVPPPGEGSTTVAEAVPDVVISLAEIAAVNCALLTKVVVRALPFHCTVEPGRKLVPVTVSENAAPPAVADAGKRFEMTGTGCSPVPAKLTVCGSLGALSVNASEALRLPAAEGVNVTLTAHVPLGITVAPVQVSAPLAKSLEFGPLIMTVEMRRLPAPVLVTVTCWAALLVLRDWGGNVRLAEEKLAELETKLPTRFEALTVPIPVAKSHPGAAPNAGS